MYLRVADANVQRFGPAYRFGGHEHVDVHEILVGLGGVTGVQRGEEVHWLEAGDFLLVPPGVFHFMWEAAAPAAYFNSHVDGDLPSLGALRLDAALRLEPGWSERLGAPFDVEAGYWMVVELLRSVRTAVLPEVRQRGVPEALPSFRDGLARELARLVTSEPSRRFRLAELAERFSLHPSWLTTKMKAATGFGAMELVWRVKLDLGRSWIRDGMAVGEASRRLGFASASHFSRRFRGVFGRPPSEAALTAPEKWKTSTIAGPPPPRRGAS